MAGQVQQVEVIVMVNNYTYTRRAKSQVDTSQEKSQKRKVGPDDYKN